MKFWDDEKSITLTRCVVVAALIGSISMTLESLRTLFPSFIRLIEHMGTNTGNSFLRLP